MRTQFEVFPIAFATLALAAARVMAPGTPRLNRMTADIAQIPARLW